MDNLEKIPGKGGRLTYWQNVIRQDENDWQSVRDDMTRQEQLLRGTAAITAPGGTPAARQTGYRRNLVQEIIETEVDSNIPQPKVTALYREDEDLARIIEDMLRNELDRLPMEVINDLQERVTPTHGADFLWVDWDQTICTHTTLGDARVREIHPRQFIPQAGVYDIDEMEHFCIKIPRTWQYILRRYRKDVRGEDEEDREARSEVDGAAPDGIVTEYLVFYRNDQGGIGRYSFVGDTELEDLEDCQARRRSVCARCGAEGNGVKCMHCDGTEFRDEVQTYEELTEDLTLFDGTVLSAWEEELDEFGLPVPDETAEPEILDVLGGGGLPGMGGMGAAVMARPARMRRRRIPCYTPGMYPIVMRKNVSMAGQLLGGSDADAIAGQQNEMSKISGKLSTKVMSGGSFTTKPEDLKFEFSDQDGRVLSVKSPQQLDMIRSYNTQVDISADLRYRAEIYEEARNIIGITDAFQGRKDATATSAVAKQFSAAQAAGRLESKRIMKNDLYQRLFERLFKWKLAYADEPRPIVTYNAQGQREYRTFNRWDFLRLDADGRPYWNDNFLFSCDTSAPLASNREQMWQEMRSQRSEGAFGDPTSLDSLILYWSMMEQLHYPMAGTIKGELQRQKQSQEEAAAAQAGLAQRMGAGTAPQGIGTAADPNMAQPGWTGTAPEGGVTV